MSYQAHLSDVSYLYDGTYPGFLCCVYESYAKREIPAAVLGPDQGQTTLFGQCSIATDPARAARVAAGLKRLGPAVQDGVTVGFLADIEGKDLTLLRYARLCFERGAAAAQMLGDADVAAAYALERAVRGESCKYIEFLRFEQRGAMLGTIIHPKHRILPLLRGHFCSRLPDEDFLIFDATHGMALVRSQGQVHYMQMQRYAPAPDAAEEDWQALWKRFFKALTIEQRRNERCQRTHAPKRYWQDMCEMRPDGRGAR